MNLLEHESKALLAEAKIKIPRAALISSADDSANVTLPAVLKSQVPVGGRGKAGGIKVVTTQDELTKAAKQIFQLEIKGHLPPSLLAEELLKIEKEFYLSILFDRTSANITIVAHTDGGMEVEDNTDFQTWPIESAKDADTIGQALADYYNLPGQTFILQDMVEKLYRCFTQNDATLIEINPLVFTADEQLIAGDCKISLDDAAAFRHDWNFADTPAEANFVTINSEGNVATIANGAGLAMATVDAACDAGLTPANFLDIGGGASTETLLSAFHRILEYPQVKAIIVNIFAGITRSDEVARAIVAAKEQIPHLPPLSIRLAGTSYDEAAAILHRANITIMPSLEDCLAAAKEVVDGGKNA